MKKMPFVLCVLLVSISASFAATFGNSSLKGKYSFQLVASHLNMWNATITCQDPQGNPYTVEAGGSNVSTDSILGVATFDGLGALVLTIAGGGTGNFLLELAGTGAVRNFVSVTEYGAGAPNRVFHSGSAVLQ
jgi:hypothetical protein